MHTLIYTSFIDNLDRLVPVKLLAHPGVRTAHITCGAGDTPSLEFLQELAPAIQRLDVSLATPGLGCGAFPVLNRLTAFQCQTTLPSTSFLRHLGSLPELRILDVYVGSKTLSPLVDGAAMFPSLQRLLLTVTGLDVDVPAFLGLVTSKELKMVYVNFDRQPTSAQIRHCARVVAKQPHLSRVDFRVQPAYDADIWVVDEELKQTEPYIVTGNDLRPLLAVPHMTTFVMRGIPLSFKDEDIQDMALAWPQLKDLVLGSASETALLGLTLESLKPLSAHCPKLRSLAVSLDTTSPAPSSSGSRKSLRKLKNFAKLRPLSLSRRHSQPSLALAFSNDPPGWSGIDSEPACTRLESLDLSNSLITDPHYVASFIARYFPNVREVTDVTFIVSNLNMLEKVNKVLKKQGMERWEAFDRMAEEAGETFHNSLCFCGHCKINPLFLILYSSGSDAALIGE